MELQLQFGYGMMDHSRVLIRDWGGGTVILSPRDLNPQQLRRLAGDVVSTPNGEVLLDPQFYLPYADHERLTSHEFWPAEYSTDDFWSGAEIRELIRKLVALNTALRCKAMLLPGLYAERVDDDWLARQKLVIDEAGALTELPLFVTIALGADAVRSDEQIDDILAASETWEVAGV